MKMTGTVVYNYTCGHNLIVKLTDDPEQTVFDIHYQCQFCKDRQKETLQMRETVDEQIKENQLNGCIPLTGVSSKQVRYGESIRAKYVSVLLLNEKWSLTDRYNKLFDSFRESRPAKFWIKKKDYKIKQYVNGLLQNGLRVPWVSEEEQLEDEQIEKTRRLAEYGV